MSVPMRTMPRPHGERIARLESQHEGLRERQDSHEKRVDGLEAKLGVVHDFVLRLSGGKAAILLVITVSGSLAGMAAGIVTVARFILRF